MIRATCLGGSSFPLDLADSSTQRRQADPHSSPKPVDLDCGIQLRGSIDLVERHPSGHLRISDHKTGKSDGEDGQIIAGGKSLQPALYALVAEKLFRGELKVDCGRLYFCTSAGGFSEVTVPLDRHTRSSVAQLAEIIGEALDKPFLPAAPAERQCAWCDYQPVCGPYEELRTRRKPKRATRTPPQAAGHAMTVSKAKLADAEARRRILTDFGTTLFVEAAAGTGKTTALVGRIVALICEGVSTLDRIVAVTFTEKAAGEMKLRLRAEIERARNAKDLTPERSARLAKALSHLELARIGTIHAFCGDLLRERPVEAGIDPLFEVAAEDQAADLMDRAFDTWFQNALADPPEGVRRILRRRSKSQKPRDALRNAATNLAEHRDFPTPWRRDPFNRTSEIDELIRRLTELGEPGPESLLPHG